MPIDHRRLGRDLGLFESDPLAGAGLPLWLPDGAAARYEVETYVRDLERRAGYRHVYSPVLGRREMYELSGHWRNFAEDMFPPMRMNDRAGPGDALILRPSLCPHHVLVYRSRQRSYRDLPLRIAELGGMYRAERSGVLGGLTRVRSIWLNDAHIFCAPGQVGDEIAGVLALMRRAHAALGLRPSSYRLSLRGDGGKHAGDDATWRLAGGLLRDALDAAGVDYQEAPGDAAFYGPKIDIQVADPAGREATLSTIQVDLYQPERFELSYVDASGARVRPVMVHRSLVGSMERLFAHLIERHGGAFPVWYAPVQAVFVPVEPAQEAAARALHAAALDAGLRAEVDLDGSLAARVRQAARRRVPYVGVVGPLEAAAGAVALRLRDGRRLPAMPGTRAVRLIGEVAAARSPDLLPTAA